MIPEYQPRTAERLVEILMAQDQNPRSWQAEAADTIKRLTAEAAHWRGLVSRADRAQFPFERPPHG